MACIQTRTMPSDEDAIEDQLRGTSSNRVVQLTPVSVDVEMEPLRCIVGAMVGAAVGAMVGAAVGAMVGAAVGAIVGAAVGAMVGAAVGCIVGGSVLGTITSYTLESGSKMKGVHTPMQQKHWLVTVFQLK
jgi:hypothetical protein